MTGGTQISSQHFQPTFFQKSTLKTSFFWCTFHFFRENLIGLVPGSRAQRRALAHGDYALPMEPMPALRITNFPIKYSIFHTSGNMTNVDKVNAKTIFTQKSHLKNVKYDATTDPKCDSISFIRSCHGTKMVEKFKSSLRKCCHFYNERTCSFTASKQYKTIIFIDLLE